jgi:hypothetical protein
MAHDINSIDGPFRSLEAYDWGADAGFFKAIDAAVIAAHGDAILRGELEKRLSAILSGDASRAAKEYACRKLSMIGTASSVPPLALLLPQKEHSHMARFALERIAGGEATDALREAFSSLNGDLKLGMMASLAARRDAASVPLFAALLAGDERTAVAAADALGMIRDSAAAEALAAVAASAGSKKARAITDARLACAEAMLAEGKRSEAMVIYRAIEAAAAGSPAEKPALLAAKRGIVACLDTTP